MAKYEGLAKEIIEKIGGSQNVSVLTHCMTRLRFTLKDTTKANADMVKEIEGVINVIEKGGQFQVVIGTHVSEVYEAICSIGGNGDGSSGDVGTISKVKWHERVLDVISGSFSPIIPALAGAGMLKALLVIFTTFGWVDKVSQTYYILNYVSDTAFYFLPFLLAYSASIKMKTSTVISMLLAGMLLHPSLGALKDTGEAVAFLGIPVRLATYSSSVIPILLIVWAQSYVEKFAKKISPNAVKVFLVPMITLLILTPVGLCALGPVGSILGDYMAMAFEWLNAKGPWIAPFLIGTFTPPLVMTGMHYSLLPISTAQYATMGYGTILAPGMTSSNIAQGIASLAVALRTKDKNLKQIALSSGITGVMGITEPALYGVNLPLKYPLFSAMIGGGLAGLYGGLMGVKSFASASPGLAALPIFIGGDDMSNFFHAIIMILISIIVTFVVAYTWGGYELKKQSKDEVKKASSEENKLVSNKPTSIQSPLQGEVVALSDVEDEVFSKGMMGNGVAIRPSEGKLVAPFDGKVIMVFNTSHAIGLVSEDGVEVLIHIGMDTVDLKGKGFTVHVQSDQKIKAGDLLVEFDMKFIHNAGYSTITPIVITNSDVFENITITNSKSINRQEYLMTVSK